MTDDQLSASERRDAKRRRDDCLALTEVLIQSGQIQGIDRDRFKELSRDLSLSATDVIRGATVEAEPDVTAVDSSAGEPTDDPASRLVAALVNGECELTDSALREAGLTRKEVRLRIGDFILARGAVPAGGNSVFNDESERQSMGSKMGGDGGYTDRSDDSEEMRAFEKMKKAMRRGVFPIESEINRICDAAGVDRSILTRELQEEITTRDA